METRVHEIAAGIYRLSTLVDDVSPDGFTFNQFLIDAEEPMLFHTGMRGLFPLVSEAVARIMPIERLRWIGFGHVEADECGSMNSWLAAAPHAQVAYGQLGCAVQLNDLSDRPPRALANGEVLDIGGRRMRWIDTPHVPHGWEAGVFYEEVEGVLFSGDLLTHGGDAALTEGDIAGPAIAMEEAMPSMSMAPATVRTLRELAALSPSALAVMHGASVRGAGAARQLQALADWCEARVLA